MNNKSENEKDWEWLEDSALVKLAQSGENEAFGELVRRHRSQVYGYARTITHESFLAEDIVQDALIRAFMHLGKLVDVERFLPWMHRIVRNQAWTRLNKASSMKEQALSEFGSNHLERNSIAEDWSHLDGILRKMNRSAEEFSASDNVPEERLMQKETLRVLTEIIACLKPRERQIFEAHFFDQLSPQEIAKLFQLSSANVYQIISRSRKKVIQERIRITVDNYVKSRKDMGNMKKVILPNSETMGSIKTWNTVTDVLYSMLQYTDKKLSHSMIMGLTGYAFQINIVPENVHIAGPTAYDFADVLKRGLKNLGVESNVVDGLTPSIGPNTNLIDPALMEEQTMEKRQIHQALPEALELIHHSLDRGYPVLAWDIFFPEFGLIYGYDDDSKQLYTDECGKRKLLPYDNLGRSILEEIFVLAIHDTFEVNLQDQLQNALHMILDHYDGKGRERPSDSIKGIRAYDTWCDAYQGETVEPNGNAYNIAVYSEGHKYAVEFLKELQMKWPDKEKLDKHIRALLGEGVEAYEDIASNYSLLHQMFPFPKGGEPNDPANAQQSIELLQKIKRKELEGVGIFRDISGLLQ